MRENIKRHPDIAAILVLGVLALAFILFMGALMGPEMARGAQEGSSTAWATVGAMYTCDVLGTAIAFATLNDTQVFAQASTPSASTTILITSNDLMYFKVYDTASSTDPGLLGATTTPQNVIGSANDSYANTATLAAGTEGYGIRASTTTDGSNQKIANAEGLSFRYGTSNQGGTVNTNYVGGLEGGFASAVKLASTTDNAVTSDRQIEINYRVAVAANTPAGDYKSIVNYLCTTSL